MPVQTDLWYRKTNVQVIAIIDIIISTLTLMLTAWNLFRDILFIKSNSMKIGFEELGHLFAAFVTILMTIGQWFVAKRLITDTNKISEKPRRALRGCLLWRRYSFFLLVLWISSLAYLVYINEHNFPLIYLICDILFRIFALFYVGLLAKDLKKLLEPSMKNSDTFHIFPDGESQNTTIIQISDYSDHSEAQNSINDQMSDTR